jgi:hypothetical protein
VEDGPAHNDEPPERRHGPDPNYRGPRRRKDDGSKGHTPLPKPPETP